MGPAGTVAGDIGSRNAESCAAYNMLKVSRSLFFMDQDPAYMDYFERTLLNHILGGRSRGLDNAALDGTRLTPGNCYMYPVNPGTTKEYGNGNIGTCCGGSALESHVKYQDTIWTHSADDETVLVNLYTNSTLTWASKSVTLTQETRYPQSDTIRITVTGEATFGVQVRIPGWTHGATVTVAGGAATQAPSGAYFSIPGRAWKTGDVIEIVLPWSCARRRRPTGPTSSRSSTARPCSTPSTATRLSPRSASTAASGSTAPSSTATRWGPPRRVSSSSSSTAPPSSRPGTATTPRTTCTSSARRRRSPSPASTPGSRTPPSPWTGRASRCSTTSGRPPRSPTARRSSAASSR
ncbi:hypothetical protein G7085_07215 [Tessaracoccus sp. HDW20]|uniref:beta-L-arabinofuranosidase domain-containing protein n=1 Tax=Tessaracoccus coleopterorum TaxID=2714950 RepID=UPI0018D4A548|nr:hypothetical protein [Tessaracoccus coleopterorum]